eukprot:364404-Chlamydomonas_euryale.AAC.3
MLASSESVSVRDWQSRFKMLAAQPVPQGAHAMLASPGKLRHGCSECGCSAEARGKPNVVLSPKRLGVILASGLPLVPR